MAEFQNSFPSFIWLFKTPPGAKGQLQLLARVVWADPPALEASPTAASGPDESVLHYLVQHPKSVWFEGGESDEAVARVSRWAREHLYEAVRARFRGSQGQHALRGRPLHELEAIARQLKEVAFENGAAGAK